MKNAKQFTLTREQVEAIFLKAGFQIAGPDHPVYREPITLMLRSGLGSRGSFLPRAEDAGLPSVEPPAVFTVLSDGTIRSGRSRAGVEYAKSYFEEFPHDVLDAIGVEVIDGECPGSDYFAACLKTGVKITDVNRAAKKLQLPIRLRKKRNR